MKDFNISAKLACFLCKIDLPANAQKIIEHKKNHHPEKNRKHCIICRKIFTAVTSTDQHYLIHTKEKPHPCLDDSCPKRFSTASDMRIHHNRYHLKKKTIICPTCLEAFYSYSDRSKHANKTNCKHDPTRPVPRKHHERDWHMSRETCKKSSQESSFYFGVNEDSISIEGNKDNPFLEPAYSKGSMERYLIYQSSIHDTPDLKNFVLDIEVSTSEESSSDN